MRFVPTLGRKDKVFMVPMIYLLHATKHEKIKSTGPRKFYPRCVKLPSCLLLLDPKSNDQHDLAILNFHNWTSDSNNPRANAATFFDQIAGIFGFRFGLLSLICTLSFPACRRADPSDWIWFDFLIKWLDRIGFHIPLFQEPSRLFSAALTSQSATLG